MTPRRTVLIAAAGALVAGFLAGAFSGRAFERMTSAPAASFMETQRGHLARLDGASLPGRVVFLGSSTFQGLDVSAVTPLGLNLGLGGETIVALAKRIETYRAPAHARAVVINAGLNDLMQRCRLPEAGLDSLFAHIPPATPTIVLGVQGVDPARHGTRCDGQIPRLIADLNRSLAAACARRPHCSYVAHPIAPADNAPELAALRENDGIHLSPAGYRKIIEALRTAIARIDPALASPPSP